MYSKAILAAAALIGSASAFAPTALPMGLRQRSATAKISGYFSSCGARLQRSRQTCGRRRWAAARTERLHGRVPERRCVVTVRGIARVVVRLRDSRRARLLPRSVG